MTGWQFWIDVGGTFTDCLGLAADGRLHSCKVLSSAVTKGVYGERLDGRTFRDDDRSHDPPGFWRGYRLRFLDEAGRALPESTINSYAAGRYELSERIPQGVWTGTRYEIVSDEEAPILAIRTLLGLRRDQPVPASDVRLGTTRGTNALLTRSGARTAFLTTRGFADVLKIANQDRPKLFSLSIEKPAPLFECTLEVDERIAADGRVLVPLSLERTREQLGELKRQGIESLAICLMHAFENPAHEEQIECIAVEVGFTEISRSSRVAPFIKIVSRGDTTVADAYLNPVLREYLARIKRQLGGGTLQVMTSAGGLVQADQFLGKDSILSGPAGGVIGFSRVAECAGFAKSIGFDMGGTSTDVARYDGRLEREFETTKAGVRIVAPMLAIETVAAGGGSICRFDGVKLVVGPESAGADPGPACYGRGGPLTVTDVNFWLGRIVEDHFPFPLDSAAVARRLDEIDRQMSKSTPRNVPDELAHGFIAVANANMARAIRKVSVARGFNPADYALIAFGGAGGQHACAVSRALGIRTILAHPHAGVLSAYGMGLADVRAIGEKSLLRAYADVRAELPAIFAELEATARREVIGQRIPADRVRVSQRTLELRYSGIEATLLVAEPADGDVAAEYERLHAQHFGYRREGRAIEAVAARVEVIGELPHAEERAEPLIHRTATPCRHQLASFQLCGSADLDTISTPIFRREDLRPGDTFVGPAIILEPTSTIVVESDFTASVLARGEIKLEDQSEPENAWVSTNLHSVELEIFNNLFASIAEEMGETLRRTAISTNVKERLDFSCALFTASGELVVNAPHIPVHLGAMGETVKCVLAENPMRPGDVYVSNDPYRGGSHLPDVTVVTPAHDEQTGELLFITASRAHHAEIGGTVPGSMPPFSRTLGEEGVRIRNFRLVEGGRVREQELAELLSHGPYPSRNVADNLADIAAQVAANARGAARLRALVDERGWLEVSAYMTHIRNAAAEKMRRALARFGSGTYSRIEHLDDSSPIAVTITIADQRATVDFTGTGPVRATNLNANRAIVTAAVLYVFRCLIDEDIPLNSGVLEPIDVILPECLLNPREAANTADSPAMVGGNVETSQRVVDCLLGALGVAAASQGTMNNLTFGDESFGYYETICGGSGATGHAQGADAVHTHMTNTRLTDPEVIERRYPVRVREFCIRSGSGGAGSNRGGDGVVRRIEFLRPLTVSMLSERRGPYPPFGLADGAPGALGRNTLERAAGGSIDLGGKFALHVAEGDVLTIETPGGGGWGAPARRG